MNSAQSDRIVIGMGILHALYVCYVLMMMNDPAVLIWNIFYGALFTALLICAWNLMRCRSWAYYLSLAFAAAGLGLGIYFLHFAWTFWIFKEPSFFERLGAALHPRISIFTIVPVIWLVYFSKPTVKARFLCVSI